MAPLKQDLASQRPRWQQWSTANQAVRFVKAVLLDRRYFWHFTAIFLLGEALLGLLIIRKVPYTKIDWPAYMQQVEGFLDGEKDYSKLEGDTGPLVYPALHLYIYTLFHKYLPYPRIKPAQYIYLFIYLFTHLEIAGLYFLASPPAPQGRRSGVPQALLIPLALSKRAHSIYLLRLFNDPITTVLLYASVLGLMIGARRGGEGYWRVGAGIYSLALGMKMNVLLFLPGLLVILFQYRGIKGTIESLGIIITIQLLLPAPFFYTNTTLAKAYFTSAFDLSRQFLYEWTVNWRFLTEETFLSGGFARSLLISQLSLLVLFAWFRWSPIQGGTLEVLRRGLTDRKRPTIRAGEVPSYHIPVVLFTSNLIGMITARSLHYQFHTWYFHQIPLLLYLGGAWGNLFLGVSLWGLIEWSWATAPATPMSSGVLLFAHLVILGGLWFRGSTTKDEVERMPRADEKIKYKYT